MIDYVSALGVVGPALDNWPVGTLVLQRTGSAPGDWHIVYSNQLARQRLDLAEARAASATSLYEVERRLGIRRTLVARVNAPEHEHDTEGIEVVVWGEHRVLQLLPEPGADAEISLASRALGALDKDANALAFLCDWQGGRVRLLHDAASALQQNRDGQYVDELLITPLIEPVLDLLDLARASGGVHRSFLSQQAGIWQLAASHLTPAHALILVLQEPAEQNMRHRAASNLLMAGLSEIAIGVDGDGRVMANTGAASSFWDRDIVGLPVGSLIRLPGVEPGRMWAFLRSAMSEELVGRPFQAVRNKGNLRPVSVARRDVDLGDERLHALIIEPDQAGRRAEQTIRDLAHFDALTGLPNRQLFSDRLAYAIASAEEASQTLPLLVVDIDRFKLINDSLGLDLGDMAIRAIAKRLQDSIEPDDTLARSSADEFLLLCTTPGSAEETAKLAKSIQAAMHPPLTVGPYEISVSVSIGIAMLPHDGSDPATLLRNAYSALNRAKAGGRNSTRFYTEDMNVTAYERLMLETRLRRAIQQNALSVYFQPQIAAQDSRVVGVEALLRWHDPELGMISPGDFIPLAEETGLILPIGQWVLRAACEQVVRWHRAGHEGLRLAVNISAIQFERDELNEEIRQVLEDTGLPPDKLELELTEGVVMRDAAATASRLGELRKLGVSLAVDDFGTGYSSLAYLKRFPLRSLKIDRSFVGDIDRDPHSTAIVQAIIALGQTMDMNLVAEGVETEAQRDVLCAEGCQEMQGYLFARPMPADELEKFLETYRSR